MSALCAEKITLHPASHNWGTEMREYDASSGTRCARLASFGSLDNGNSPICVEDIRAPFGFSIDNGFVAGRQLSKGKLVTTKFPVVPESRIVGEIWVGGPVVSMCKELEAKCFPGSGGSLQGKTVGSPPFQALVSALELLSLFLFRRRRDMIVVEPPIMFSRVASRL